MEPVAFLAGKSRLRLPLPLLLGYCGTARVSAILHTFSPEAVVTIRLARKWQSPRWHKMTDTR